MYKFRMVWFSYYYYFLKRACQWSISLSSSGKVWTCLFVLFVRNRTWKPLSTLGKWFLHWEPLFWLLLYPRWEGTVQYCSVMYGRSCVTGETRVWPRWIHIWVPFQMHHDKRPLCPIQQPRGIANQLKISFSSIKSSNTIPLPPRVYIHTRVCM